MTDRDQIIEAAREILSTLPPGVTLVAAAKTRSPEEVIAAIEAGVAFVGHNYVQEAERMVNVIGRRAHWHLLGHLQKNKVKQAVDVFDLIESVDTIGLAETIDARCAAVHRVMPILIEVNSGNEPNKTGVSPENAEELVRRLSRLAQVRVQGLMTMGPLSDEPEDFRPYFRTTRRLFERLAAAQIPKVEMRHLSMGMSSSYRVAIEEGANMVRIGTAIFGSRPPI
jgi:PLP dependent protein